MTRGAATVAAIVLTAVGAGPAAHAAVPRQTGSFTYTSTVPGTATGLVIAFDFQNPEDPDLKPHTVGKMVIRTPPGGVVDTTVRPRCRATDAELYALGPAGCPPETKAGGGVAVSDSGGDGPLPRYSNNFISDFNGDGEIIGVGENEGIPVVRSVDHTKIDGNTSTTELPIFPGVPPPDPYTPLKSLDETFPAYVNAEGRPWARTPPTCPASGYWTITAEFTYRDGVVETLASRSPCQRGKPRAATSP
ncbi:MAG TPA: hypothetical protein VF520_15325 [Thermoleophilaceae bacterium]